MLDIPLKIVLLTSIYSKYVSWIYHFIVVGFLPICWYLSSAMKNITYYTFVMFLYSLPQFKGVQPPRHFCQISKNFSFYLYYKCTNKFLHLQLFFFIFFFIFYMSFNFFFILFCISSRNIF